MNTKKLKKRIFQYLNTRINPLEGLILLDRYVRHRGRRSITCLHTQWTYRELKMIFENQLWELQNA